MKRILTFVVTILVTILLQTTVFQQLKLSGISPNLVLILVVSLALMRGRTEGMLIGFCCGLLLDIMYGSYLGIYALAYLLIGYLNGCFNHMFYADDIVLPLGLVIVNDLFVNLCVYVFYFLLRNRLDFLFYLRYIIFPEMIYTIVVTLVFYKILLVIHLKLKSNEKRSV